jgi:hypothetical protein
VTRAMPAVRLGRAAEVACGRIGLEGVPHGRST